MSRLRIRPKGVSGKIHDITPQSAGWGHVGFGLYRLKAGATVTEYTDDREMILVLVEGHARIIAAGQNLGELGDRMSVFEKTLPHCVYVANGTNWSAITTTGCTLAVCSAPGFGRHPTQIIGPSGVEAHQQGSGGTQCQIHTIAMEDRDVAGSLIVTEVFTPGGNWSSYPPHRHDEDSFPEVTLLEETNYHRLNPAQGYGHQRVFTEDGRLDETLSFSNHDVVLVPRGYHPFGIPWGYESYTLNVMAGPIRKWRAQYHPAHEWIALQDQD